MKPKTIAYLELSLLALAIALFLWWIYPEESLPKAGQEDSLASTTVSVLPAFANTNLEAKSAYVYDALQDKVLFSNNEELQLPLASLTKIMTALTASTLLPEYAPVRITLDDLKTEGDSGLHPDEEWNIKSLIDFSLLVSSNDGAQALATTAGSRVAYDENKTSTQLFVQRMNTLSKEIGLHETYFLNPSGLDVSATLSGGYGSAKDMTMLLEYILEKKPHLLEATTFDRLEVSSKIIPHTAVNTNKLIDRIPNVLASKTGFTDLSGGNLVVAFDAGVNHPIIISILGSSYDGRFDDMNKLVRATLEYLAQ